MSDFDDDFDAQLLELAGATERKKKRRQGSSGDGGERSKKRRTSNDRADSGESAAESEENDERRNGVEDDYEDPHADPFPLEGKYIDEDDRRELLNMTELKREQILEERAEKKQRIQNAKALADMVRQQQKGVGGSGGAGASGSTNGTGANGSAIDEDSVSRAAKRQHAPRGATKEKNKSLDVLKAKRKAKDDNKRSKAKSPSRERSTSPQDMDISDSESEDGQITKMEQEDERLLNLSSGGYDASRKKERKGTESEMDVDGGNTPAQLSDLESCRLSRDAIAKHCYKPWFQDYVTGAWVRYLIGAESNGQPVYRLCEVQNLAADLVKPYKVNDQAVNQAFELKHGGSVRVFNMDKVSNAPFSEREYERLVKTCSAEHTSLPTKRSLEVKRAQMLELAARPMTEADITQILKAKAAIASSMRGAQGLTALERSRLNQERTLALRRGEFEHAEEVEAKLNEDAAVRAAAGSANGSEGQTSRSSDAAELLARVNERNRKANMEAVRKAELAEAERKKRERERRAKEAQSQKEKLAEEQGAGDELDQMFEPLAGTNGGSKRSFQAAALEGYEIDLGDF